MTRTARSQARRHIVIRHGLRYACGHEWPQEGDPQRRTVLYWARATNDCPACCRDKAQEQEE
jgi:hypothetical protein